MVPGWFVSLENYFLAFRLKTVTSQEGPGQTDGKNGDREL